MKMLFPLHDPIYGHDIMITIGDVSDKQLVRAFERHGYLLDPEMVEKLHMSETAQGRTVIDLETGARVIRLRRLNVKDPRQIGVLAHEAAHAAIQLFERINQPIGSSTDEPFAYYVQFIVRSVLERVTPRKRSK